MYKHRPRIGNYDNAPVHDLYNNKIIRIRDFYNSEPDNPNSKVIIMKINDDARQVVQPVYFTRSEAEELIDNLRYMLEIPIGPDDEDLDDLF